MKPYILFLIAIYMLYVCIFVTAPQKTIHDNCNAKKSFYHKFVLFSPALLLLVSTLIGPTQFPNFSINIGYALFCVIYITTQRRLLNTSTLAAIICINVAYLCTVYVDILNLVEINFVPLFIIVTVTSSVFARTLQQSIFIIITGTFLSSVCIAGESNIFIGHSVIIGYDTMIVIILSICIALLIQKIKQSLILIKKWHRSRIWWNSKKISVFFW